MTSSPPTDRPAHPDEPAPDAPNRAEAATRRRFPMAAPRVFIPAAVILVVFSTIAAIFPDRMGELLQKANSTVVIDLGWWYVLVVTSFVAFSFWMALSPMGSIEIGRAHV